MADVVVLVGTRKGLFVLQSDEARRDWELRGPYCEGWPIFHAIYDRDAGTILAAYAVGASYGYSLLWAFIPMTISLIVVQEMCVRMGVVTGQGLADLIRECFSVCVAREIASNTQVFGSDLFYLRL